MALVEAGMEPELEGVLSAAADEAVASPSGINRRKDGSGARSS